MQDHYEKSNETTLYFEGEKEKSNQSSPKIVYQRRFSSNNAQLSDFIEIFNKDDGKIFNDLDLKEGYIKFHNTQANNRIYAKSVTKRRTPISFKMRGSSCQKQREDDQNIQHQTQNQVSLKQDNDNYLQSDFKYLNGQKEDLHYRQTNGAFKKLSVSPIQKEYEEQKDAKQIVQNKQKVHSPSRAITNSFAYKMQPDVIKEQHHINLESSFKANTESLRQNRVKNKLIDSSFLTGKREGNLGYNSNTITTNLTNARMKNSVTPIIDVSEVNAVDQKVIQNINPKTLPFLSSDRGVNQNHHFHFGEFKLSTQKAPDLFQNLKYAKTQKQSHKNQQVSQSVTTTITYNNNNGNQQNTNKITNINRMKNNTICTNQNIIHKPVRYSSHTPSKRVQGVIVSQLIIQNQQNKETVHASNRNSQIRKRQQIIQKQNNILANSIQQVYCNIDDSSNQLPMNRKVNNTANLDSTNHQVNENQEKSKQSQFTHSIQQAINKQQFNKIFVNFSKLRREGQDLGKGFLGTILTSIPKHPIYNQISQRQKNNLSLESRINNKEKESSQNYHKNEHGLQQSINSNKNLEIVESLIQKISSQLNDLQVNLSIMKSSNKILLDAIDQKEDTEIIFHEAENLISSKQISKIQINNLIPLMKQCFDSTFDLTDPSTMAFLLTDNEDEQDEVCSNV